MPVWTRGFRQTAPTWLSRSEGIKPSFTALAAPPPFAYSEQVSTPISKSKLRAAMRARRRELARAFPDWLAFSQARADACTWAEQLYLPLLRATLLPPEAA